MVSLKADALMASMNVSAGKTIKTIPSAFDSSASATSTIGSSTKSSVRLSPAAVQITSLLTKASQNTPVSAGGFDSFINNLHSEMMSNGSKSEFLLESPNSSDPSRLHLAKQAANYLSVSLYSGESVHNDVSSENPFASLDRKSLSTIAFDESGTFTSAERQVAFLEMTSRDVEYRNKTFDLQAELTNKNDNVLWGQVTSYLRDAELSTAMTEAEKSWRNWPSEDELRSKAESLAKSSGATLPALPAYENLSSNSALAAVSDSDGNSQWANVPLKSVEKLNLSLIQAIQESPAKSAKVADEGEQSKQAAVYNSIKAL